MSKRDKIITIRLTEEEYASIRYYSGLKSGYDINSQNSISEIIRQAINEKFPLVNDSELLNYQIYCSGLMSNK